jgi:hypothetical protein
MLLAISMIGGGVSIDYGHAEGQTAEPTWRRTAQGWEYAHAVQSRDLYQAWQPESGASESSGSIVALLRKWNPVLLPVAVSCFFLTFGIWLLITIENRAIIRRLSPGKE